MNKEYDGLSQLIQDIILHDDHDKNEKEYKNYSKYLEMSAFENDLINQKINVIAGIDEVGRGPLAGPVVAAAVILPHDFYLPGLDDSKKLSAKKRDLFYDEIIKHAISYDVGFVSVDDIDKYNIYQATILAMKKAITGLNVKPMHLLIDAMKLDIDIPQTSIIKGDAKSISIAAASIVAKVTRDRYMADLHQLYPVYNFKQNAGYGTKEHLEAIQKYGITKEHRKSFEPIKSIVQQEKTLFNF